MTDRLKSSPEFETTLAPDISLSDLLKVDINNETLTSLNSSSLSLTNSQNLYRSSDGETFQGVSIKFEFSPPGQFPSYHGRISLSDELTGTPDLSYIRVRDLGSETTWEHEIHEDNPGFIKSVVVILPGLDPQGFRRIREKEGEWLVFDGNYNKVEDETKGLSLEAHKRGMEISAYVLKTALANPSIFQQVDNPLG